MASHNQLGKDGEKLAEKFLLAGGYEIIHKNWRYSYYEIDIIARKNDKLHIIEVKTLHETPFGHPEDSVTKTKFRRLLNAAGEFLYQHPQYRHVQYDVLAITIRNTGQHDFFLLEDVYL